MVKVCKHCYISGKVQGVFYRSESQAKATQLGVTGWVKNLRDGRVEAMVCGEEDSVSQLIDWFYQGPDAAIVESVSAQDAPYKEENDFIVIGDDD